MSTLTVPPNICLACSPHQDAIDLYKAFKGFFCDSSTVVEILAHRDATQRSLIQKEYRAMYSEELTVRLSKKLSGNFKRAMLLWVLDPASRDATILREALSGDVSDLHAATEVLCSRTPSEIQIINQTYLAQFGAYLEHDIQFRTVGDHQKLLLSYIGIIRHEGPQYDPSMVAKDAKDLFIAGERNLGTDVNLFIRIFSERSRAHLVAVSSAYFCTYGSFLEKATKCKSSGLFGLALLSILTSAKSPGKYFAKVLHKAIKGLGTSDPTSHSMLTRTVVSRTEIDICNPSKHSIRFSTRSRWLKQSVRRHQVVRCNIELYVQFITQKSRFL